jgi:hypothetical protein
MNDNDLITFKAIASFVTELHSEYGKRHRPLKLYVHMLNKTKISHEKAILKHINAFRDFCVSNRIQIVETDTKFLETKIMYSKRVYIDMKEIFSMTDDESSQVIWQHILCISSLVDPAGKAKEVFMKRLKEETKDGGNESNFIQNIIEKVEKNIDPSNEDPMQAIQSIMSSGVLTDMMSGIKNGVESGNLNVESMMGSIQGIIGGMSNDMDSSSQNPMSMLTNMMSMMAKPK